MTHRPISNYRLANFFLRHPRSLEVRALEHEHMQNNEILRAVWVATLQILHLEVGCISCTLNLNNALMQLYLFLMIFTIKSMAIVIC